ncbi:MAG: SusC/RagA family TonB-linked outer membrane protein [Candidatus Cryptobacteroides sp.]
MRAFKTFAVTLFLLLGFSAGALAQNRVVSGKVFDTAQQPLVGAAVMIPGTTTGAVTGDDGSFSMTVPEGDIVLEVSSLGYLSRKVTVTASKSSITVFLEEDNMTLTETVVVGYGTQKKVNLTGAITTVDAKELEDRAAHNLTNMLQGAVPGLNITTSSGVPGSAGSINIRGYTSINSADPIVVIDGVIGDMSRINANDVASISVIKDAAAAAVYGARAAYGVILITTKSGGAQDGKATVRYSGRFGWEAPTTSTDYETRGYWSVYTVDKFWQADAGKKYTTYTDHDMMQLLARVNDKTENPDRPWIVEEVRNGRNQWVYYCNTDWYHELFRDNHPVQQHNISISGGTKDVKYFLSGAYDREQGIVNINPDVYNKYNLRAKFDFKINKYMRMSNNTSFFSGRYDYPGNENIQDAFAYASRHALASFPLTNPDGTFTYGTPMISGAYNIANGRHIMFSSADHNRERKSDFTNTTELKITPVKQFSITANFTYRLYQNRNSYRSVNMPFRRYPDSEMEAYTTGAGQDALTEKVQTNQYYAYNVFGSYEDTFKDKHHLTAVAGANFENWNYKNVGAYGENIASEDYSDLSLVSPNGSGQVITTVSGGFNDYALMGFFARVNYDYMGRYLFELSGRYDGSSRFADGSRWGLFPSGSVGWRISEEPFFKNAKRVVDNLKIRGSYGTLGNQNVKNGSSQVYYTWLRELSIKDFAGYSFGEGTTMSKYSTLTAPVASDLTWETTHQWNIGLDASLFNGRLEFTGEAYVRATKNMLTDGMDLPGVYGASEPKMNAADLKTKGYELSLSWRDQFKLAGKPFGYNVRATLSDYRSFITRFNNPTKILSNYYEGQRLGEIWGYVVDGLFKTDEEAKYWTSNVVDCSIINGRMTGGFLAGDLKYMDLDGDGVLGTGANTLDNPGDRKVLGNSLPSLQYGITFGFDWLGFDFSAFFQGTGTHYWYPAGMNMAFWGPYSYSYVSFLPTNFLDNCWAEDNPDAYFPRPRAYSATGGELSKVNSRYIQNIRYLRFKNLTVGYTVPEKLTRKIHVEKIRVYFTGENLCYWSPIKKYSKYIDPESAFRRDSSSNSAQDHMSYPWPKTMMFGIDIQF